VSIIKYVLFLNWNKYLEAEFFSGFPNMVKSQFFDDILGNIDQKKKVLPNIQRYLYMIHFVSAKPV
jgi:hypothetical protein